MFARLARNSFARTSDVSSLSPEDTDLKKSVGGRYVSLAEQYGVPENLLFQHNAYGLDVDDVLVTRNFVPKFRVRKPEDFFADVRRDSLYVINYKDLPPTEFNEKVGSIGSMVESKNIRVESTDDPRGF